MFPAHGPTACLLTLTRRTVVADTLTTLSRTLDQLEGIQWHVELIKDPQYYVLQSVVVKDGSSKPAVQLWIQRSPFQITAIRTVETMPPIESLAGIQDLEAAGAEGLRLDTQPGIHRAIFWQTKTSPLKYNGNATLLSVLKPSTADYTGFGEQGGKKIFKKKTWLNYFSECAPQL